MHIVASSMVSRDWCKEGDGKGLYEDVVGWMAESWMHI